MKRAGRIFDIVYVVALWVGLGFGILIREPWLAMPAAFLILLETLDER